MTEAADEIERMEAEIERLRQALDIHWNGAIAAARNAALEEAALVVDDKLLADLGDEIAAAIRALKGKK